MLRRLFLIPAFAAAANAGENLPKPDRVAADATPEQVALVKEGVALHDEGKYEAAIAKYKQVLDQNPWEVGALFELSFTYFASKQYEQSLETARLGAQCRSASLPGFYVAMANALDELGKGKEAIEIYRAAIKQAPESRLLYYNFGIALDRAGKRAEAKTAVETGLRYEPKHASSHLKLGEIYAGMGYRIPAILAYSRFLVLEPDSKRSPQALEKLPQLLTGSVTTGKDDSHININISDNKGLKDEGDFMGAEMMLSIVVAADFMVKSKEKVKEVTSPFEKLVSLYDSLGESLENSKPKGGFAATYYAPYFASLVKAGHTEAFVAYAWQAAKIEGAEEWAKANDAKIKAFLTWTEAFPWPAK